jgi:hypothetical protein
VHVILGRLSRFRFKQVNEMPRRKIDPVRQLRDLKIAMALEVHNSDGGFYASIHGPNLHLLRSERRWFRTAGIRMYFAEDLTRTVNFCLSAYTSSFICQVRTVVERLVCRMLDPGRNHYLPHIEPAE